MEVSLNKTDITLFRYALGALAGLMESDNVTRDKLLEDGIDISNIESWNNRLRLEDENS